MAAPRARKNTGPNRETRRVAESSKAMAVDGQASTLRVWTPRCSPLRSAPGTSDSASKWSVPPMVSYMERSDDRRHWLLPEL